MIICLDQEAVDPVRFVWKFAANDEFVVRLWHELRYIDVTRGRTWLV